jgi:hypothetical protein
MAKEFFFYTDLDLLDNQAQSDAYGPISGNETTQYRVTSKHTASSDSSAYAVCDGIVFVQLDQNNSNLVNLILKPTQQKAISYSTVRFFIYRGIQLSSLINGNEIATRTNNDLTESLWTTQDLINAINNTSDTPPANALGIHLTSTANPPDQFLDTDLLEKAFFRNTNSFQFPFVKGGWSIGKFDSASFGFEIITSGLGYEPTFLTARVSENIITVTSLPGSPTPEDIFNYNTDKQRILNYIDPCAFFGLFYHQGLKAKLVSTNTTFNLLQGDQIFTQVLDKFFTSDLIYLDIRNEHNYGLNYYQNYNAGININIDGTGSNNSPYHDGNDWPIFPIVSTQFTGSGNKGLITLNLPQGDNDLPTVYLAQGFFKKRYPRNRTRLKDFSFTNNFTDDIDLAVPRHGNGNIIPQYVNLRYIKRIVQAPNTPSTPSALTLFAEHFMDNLFDLNILLDANGDIYYPFSSTAPTKWRISEEEIYIDSSSGYPTGTIAKAGIAEDANSVYFFCIMNGEDLKNSGVEIPLVSGFSQDANFITDVLKPKIQELDFRKRNIETAPSTFVSSLADSQTETVSIGSKLSPSADSVVLLAFDKTTDFAAIKNAFQQFPLNYSKRIVIRNITSGSDVNNLQYTSGDIKIIGHQNSSSNIIADIVDPNLKFYKQ